MTWSIVLMRTPSEVSRLDDLPRGYSPPTIGTRIEVIAQLQRVVKGLDFDSEHEGSFETGEYSVRLRLLTLGKALSEPENHLDPIQVISAHLRGSTQTILFIRQVCEGIGVSSFDNGTGVRLDVDADPLEGQRAASDYGEYVRGNGEATAPNQLDA